MMTTPDRESCHELTKNSPSQKEDPAKWGRIVHSKIQIRRGMQACKGWLIQYDTYEIMLSGNEPEESVSIPCDWIEELEIENRRITQIPQKNPQKEDDDLNVLPSMKLKSSWKNNEK